MFTTSHLTEGEQQPYFDDDIFQESNPDQGETQPVHESPADVPEAEPLAEDRIVPFEEDSSVTIEGVAYIVESSLRALRSGCTAVGLSTRGSKKDCFKRMVGHLKTQPLIVAQASKPNSNRTWRDMQSFSTNPKSPVSK